MTDQFSFKPLELFSVVLGFLGLLLLLLCSDLFLLAVGFVLFYWD